MWTRFEVFQRFPKNLTQEEIKVFDNFFAAHEKA